MKRKNNLKELKRNHKIHEYFIPKSVVNDLSEDSVQESIVILDNSPEISQSKKIVDIFFPKIV